MDFDTELARLIQKYREGGSRDMELHARLSLAAQNLMANQAYRGLNDQSNMLSPNRSEGEKTLAQRAHADVMSNWNRRY
jgi:hypothetical protein